MNSVYLGKSTLWFDHYAALMPEGEPLLHARIPAELSGQSTAHLLIHGPELCDSAQALEKLAAGSQTVTVISNRDLASTGGQHIVPEWMCPMVEQGVITLVCTEASTIRTLARSEFVHYVPISVPFRDGIRVHPYTNQQTVTIGAPGAILPVERLRQIAEGASTDRSTVTIHPIEIDDSTTLEGLWNTINQCDIVIDDLSPDSSPGIVSLTALTQGRTVVCNLMAAEHPDAMPSERLSPIVHADMSSVSSAIASLTRDLRALRDLSKRGRDYVKAYHRPAISRAKLMRALGR